MIEITQIKPATHLPPALSSSPPPLVLMSLGLADIMRSSWLSRTRFPMVFILETKKINKNMTNQIVMEETVVI